MRRSAAAAPGVRGRRRIPAARRSPRRRFRAGAPLRRHGGGGDIFFPPPAPAKAARLSNTENQKTDELNKKTQVAWSKEHGARNEERARIAENEERRGLGGMREASEYLKARADSSTNVEYAVPKN